MRPICLPLLFVFGCHAPAAKDTSVPVDSPNDTGTPAPFVNTCLASDWKVSVPGYWETSPIWNLSEIATTLLDDLDGDGVLDLVLSTAHSGSWILRGAGDGTFSEPLYVGLRGAVATLDANGDVLRDLAYNDGSLHILTQKSDGTFEDDSWHFGLTCDNGGNGLIQSGDFDGDGEDDLFATCADYDPGYTVFLARGRRDFDVLGGDLHHTGSVALPADWNGDGTLDVVVGGNDHTDNHLLLNDGAGGLTRSSIWTDTLVDTMASGDFDGDGVPELVAGPTQDYGLYYLDNAGTGAFTASEVELCGTYDPCPPVSMAVADIDGDGFDDVWTSNSSQSTWRLGSPTGLSEDGGGQDWLSDATHTVLGDLDKDGRIDAVTVDTLGHLDTRLGRGDGTFASPASLVSPGSHGIADITSADLDGDGRDEILAMLSSGRTLQVWTLTDGLYTPTATWESPETGHGILFVDDADADGRVEIVLADPANLQLHVLDATATFLRSIDMPDVYDVGRVADLDADGWPDILLSIDAGSSSWRPLQVGLGDGTSFTFAPLSDTIVSTWDVADVTGDGVPDVVLMDDAGQGIVFAGNGNGTFARLSRLDLGSNFVAGDFDEDGRADLVYSGDDLLHILLSVGDGTFQDSVVSDGYAYELLVADFTRDGHLDVALDDNRLLAGTGNGGLVAAGSFARSGWVAGTTDDGDGRPDLVLQAQGADEENLIVLQDPCGM